MRQKGFKFFLDIKNNGALLLDLAYFEHLSVIVTIQFVTIEQLKDLTHILFLNPMLQTI